METISQGVAVFLVNALWQIPLLAAVAALAARLMRSVPSRYQYFLWVAALGFSVALPIASLRVAAGDDSVANRQAVRLASGGAPQSLPAPILNVRLRAPEADATGRIAVPAGATAAPTAATGHPFQLPALPVSAAVARLVAFGFLLFLIFRAGRLVRAWRRTAQIGQKAISRPLPSWAGEVVERSRSAVGLGALPVLFSSEVTSPLTLGARRPAIILPDGFVERSGADEFAATLGHEMAHVARHDYALNLIAELVALPVSFHPVAGRIRRRIQETREFAADELAAERLGAASTYARSLVAIAEKLTVSNHSAVPGFSLGVFDAGNLEVRIMRLMHSGPRAGAHLATLLLVAGFSLVAATFVAAARFPLTVAQTASTAVRADLKSFLGNWTAKFEGQTYIIVSLKPSAIGLGGSVSLGNFGIDNDGQVNHVEDEPSPNFANSVTSSRLEGDTLSFVAGAHSFRMKMVGRDKAKIQWSSPNYNRAAPEPGWWTISRIQTRAETEAAPAKKALPGDAVGLVRLINTAEADYKSKTGKYASWQDLLSSGALDRVKERSQLGKIAVTSGLEVIPGYQLRLVISSSGDHYILSVEETPVKDCPIFFYSDDRGLIQEGKNIGCGSPGGGTGEPAPSAMRVKVENEVRPGGPSGGLAVGVPGGVAGGVEGSTRTIHGTVKGGVSGAVSDQSGATKIQGSVTGTVTDPSGARVPNAVVTLIASAGVLSRAVATDRDGEFLIEQVPPGTYRLVVEHQGFERAEAQVRVVGPEYKTKIDVITNPGRISQVVRVTAKKGAGTIQSTEAMSTEGMREGGQVEAPKLIYSTHPQYPQSARNKGIQGDVVLEAVISIEGVPLSLKVIQSPDPDLADAAMKAVKEWRYQPMKLNGVPVETLTDITVQFALEN